MRKFLLPSGISYSITAQHHHYSNGTGARFSATTLKASEITIDHVFIIGYLIPGITHFLEMLMVAFQFGKWLISALMIA